MLFSKIRDSYNRIIYRNYDNVPVEVYETSVGIKYKIPNIKYAPFVDHIIEKIKYTDICLAFNNFLLSPDLLKDKYTVCGKSILDSPHYLLFKEIENHSIADDSDYINRVRNGTLDARMARSISTEELLRKYEKRKSSLLDANEIEIMVIEIKEDNEKKYVILDGKHRLAFAALYNMQEAISLLLISNEYTKNAIVNRLYRYVVDSDSKNYAINQQMIELITHGS
jgi:hypothetical protein